VSFITTDCLNKFCSLLITIRVDGVRRLNGILRN